MKKQNTRRLQTLLLAAIAIIFLLGAFGSTFAQSKTNSFSMFDNFPSNASQNLWLKSASDKFDLTDIHTNNLFAANLNCADKYPKPDFSEMEKWYEIVKYEYGDFEAGETKLFFWYKPKVETRPNYFLVRYIDKDGMAVGGGSYDYSIQQPGGSMTLARVGEVSKAYAVTPTESEMEKVVKVKFIRQKS